MTSPHQPTLACFAVTAAAVVTTAIALTTITTSRKNGHQKQQTIPKQLLDSPYASELTLAVQMALTAGQNMYDYCDQAGTEAALSQDLGIATKGKPEDFCTKIDVENEQKIMQAIQQNFPSHEIIGEEAVGQGEIPPLSKETPTWIIDPIDGTTNFASGLQLTCVSIGLCANGKPVMGVVYAPMTNELYMAVAGYGAYRNNVRLVPARQPKSLAESIVSYEFGYVRDKASIQIMVEKVQKILEHGCRGTRSIGSGVLNICYVATGRLDVVYSGVAGESWKPWDYCAGHVIVNEAGGVMESIENEGPGFDLYGKSIICATSSKLAQEVRTIVS